MDSAVHVSLSVSILCSTLDPVLRLEQRGINPQGLALLAVVLAYLTATPGKTLPCVPLQRTPSCIQ